MTGFASPTHAIASPTHSMASPTHATLILASKSPARTKLLTEAGVAHRILVSDVDEDAVADQHPDAGPGEMALLLARAKAEAVAVLPEAEGALVLGCDSVFEFDGETLGKPYTAEVAIERLRAMSGRSGVLHTGHWLVDCRNGVVSSTGELASAEVEFTEMSDDDIAAYVATGEPLHCAGSFTIDGLGGAFLARVDGDPHTVVGLSVSTLRSLLARADVRLTDFWTYAVVR